MHAADEKKQTKIKTVGRFRDCARRFGFRVRADALFDGNGEKPVPYSDTSIVYRAAFRRQNVWPFKRALGPEHFSVVSDTIDAELNLITPDPGERRPSRPVPPPRKFNDAFPTPFNNNASRRLLPRYLFFAHVPCHTRAPHPHQ